MRVIMEQKVTYLTRELEDSFRAGEELALQLNSYSMLVTKMGNTITLL